jgi:hypothetical protein
VPLLGSGAALKRWDVHCTVKPPALYIGTHNSHRSGPTNSLLYTCSICHQKKMKQHWPAMRCYGLCHSLLETNTCLDCREGLSGGSKHSGKKKDKLTCQLFQREFSRSLHIRYSPVESKCPFSSFPGPICSIVKR